MKLLRYGAVGQERPGILDSEGNIRDLTTVVPDIDAHAIAPAGLGRIAAVDVASLPIVKGSPRLGVPVIGISKLIAIGLNYPGHVRETNLTIPTEPVVFLKATSCLSGADDDLIQPKHSTKMDWEVEVGIVIGSKAQYVSLDDALDHVAGYCIVNDVSERHYQFERGGQWDKGKSFDTFGPVGPYLVTKDEVGDVQNLDLSLDLNGKRMQTGNTREMIFGCAELVSYVSECMTLLPGDIIATGTPPGVGLGMKPPRYLKPGDQLTLNVQKLGRQQQRVAAFRPSSAQV